MSEVTQNPRTDERALGGHLHAGGGTAEGGSTAWKTSDGDVADGGVPCNGSVDPFPSTHAESPSFKKELFGFETNNDFYHLTDLETFRKLQDL